jgi:molybdopterin/thiamine biosynthesis adenylyltransferase
VIKLEVNMDERYIKILDSITEAEFKKLRNSNVCVVGCGAAGGYIIEMLARIGVLNITGVDDQIFNTTDLNSQSISHGTNIHENKALETKKRIFAINPDVYFTPVFEKITVDNAIDILAGNNVVIDTGDSIELRLIIEDACNKIETPLIYGAVFGWQGRISTLIPPSRSISKIYSETTDEDISENAGQLIFSYALIASLQVNEAIKVLLGKGDILHKKLLSIDLLNMKLDIQEIICDEVIEITEERKLEIVEKRDMKSTWNPFGFFKKN